ncbi:hypothetical protein FA15DRAFT_608275 [Coprinopsis marcescibilis]|uniref:Adipose-regulatory protein n=1 Tax=Coprinopsis marcescibilis TaxID=230819 RepID=A0A5C3LF57_COPMA|nr:hypothetical protein FA15DRAFT_608275 [Coprinopsis marcescibilis]
MSKEEPTEGIQVTAESPESNGFLLSSFQALFTLLRPYTPQIVPLVVCLLFIPLILVISAFAGYVVWNNLTTGWETPVYMQYGDAALPHAQVLLQSLHPQQRYDVSLRLKVPITDSNVKLGNFMTTLTLLSTSDTTLATSRRPALIVAPKAGWFYGAPNVVDIEVPLLSSFISGAVAMKANVTIGRLDGWKSLGQGEGREVNVLSASLRGLAVPHGIRGIAIRFPVISTLGASSAFLTILLTILGSCILPVMLPQAAYPEDLDSEEKPRRRNGTSSIAFPRKKRKSHAKRSVSEITGLGMKQEESFTLIPPAEEPIPERLRQRKTSIKHEPQDDDS